jgi:hypothetical protein
MKALSIRQPWAWAIIHAGKDVENRDWSDRYLGMRDARELVKSGERFLIHAAAGMTIAEYEDALYTMKMISRQKPFPAGLKLPASCDLPRGGIVGSARLAEIVTHSPSPWFCGSVGLVLADVAAESFRPMRGLLGFFRVPP